MLAVDDTVRDESAESDERVDRDDQREPLVSEAERLRADAKLREEAALRIDETFRAEFDRESSLRGELSFSGFTSGEDGGEGHGADDTQLGSSS